jgi:peptidoglycan/xylan/chitin deacetylase (PgdA/CDA1 family)
MKPLLVAALVSLAFAPAALAVFVEPIPLRTPSIPAWQQHRAVAAALRAGRPVYCGGGRGDGVALTFDDGPGPYTEQILRELRDAGAHATFFLVGNRIRYWPQAVRDEVRLGAVGNHTWSHPHLTELPRWLEWLELARSQVAIGEASGRVPRLFRAPYEQHDPTVDAVAHSLGLVEVFWSVISGDDQHHATARSVVRNVLRGLRPGAIVLMHDIHPWTVRALPRILQAIRLRGLRAVTVPELLALDAPAPHQGCPLAPGAD